MPYILSPSITENVPTLWFEPGGEAYRKENLYSIQDGKLPPVHYDAHTLMPHSLTHIETPKHVLKEGQALEHYFDDPKYFYGPAVVVKLPGDRYTPHWEVSKVELESSLKRVLGESAFPGKLLLSTEVYPETSYGYHDPEKILTLSQEAADYLIGLENFNLYGTSWKSSDYRPGSSERPIHKTLFQKGLILECLDLKDVPEGIYFLSSFPLKIKGASESPVCPVLFTKDELNF